VVEGQKGIKGWVHGSWLNFSSRHLHQDPKAAYEQFSKEMQRRLVLSQLRVFPSMANYIDMCTMTDCRPIKEDGGLTGICIHNLEVLLRGSGCYSYAWLKKQRCSWHPDKFARFCQPDHAGQLKIKAAQLFVLYGLLMQLEKPR
jgi:methylenetetrahydrofolate dehydrogenase (NADP+)/methenyltetrahydrofolate cyclohydrolase/formyltetrahydrofolate synthetase